MATGKLKIVFALILLVLMTDELRADNPNATYTKTIKALDAGVYDKNRAVKHDYRVLSLEEAVLADKRISTNEDIWFHVKFDNGEELIYQEGDMDTELLFYPEIDKILLIDCMGETVMDMKTGKTFISDPRTWHDSPDGKLRLSWTSVDGRCYYLEEKNEDGEYEEAISSITFDSEISGIYWVSNDTIHYLRVRYKYDGSEYWVAYSCRFTPVGKND